MPPSRPRYPATLIGEPCASCWGYGYWLVRDDRGTTIRTTLRCGVCGGSGLVGGGTTNAGPRVTP